MRTPSIVQFGSGAVGRGFLGQLWTEAGYTVVFVEIDRHLINRLNARGGYPLRLVDSAGIVQNRIIEPVRAIEAGFPDAVSDALTHCAFACSAVGVNAFQGLAETLIPGLHQRSIENPSPPLNLICCENQKGAGNLLRDAVHWKLPDDAALHDYFHRQVAFVDASVGRMVPPPTPELLAEDPLLLLSEPYAELPIDGSAWVGPVPPIPGLLPKTNFAGYVARKLFTHNGGHALLAYQGYQRGHPFIWQTAQDQALVADLHAYWQETGEALMRAYGFAAAEQRGQEADLLHRFRNRALGDTVARVGRDPARKVRAEDRLVGAALLCESQGIEPAAACRAIAAAYAYDAPGDPTAPEIQRTIQQEGILRALWRYSDLAPASPLARRVEAEYATIVAARFSTG